MPGLGRIPAPDARDAAYPMRALLATTEVLPRYRYWRTGPVLDQGNTGTCVGHAWRNWLSAAPYMTKTGPDAFTIYRECCAIDPWPENDSGDLNWGTSTRDGAKVLQARLHLTEYRWAFSLDDLTRWLLLRGPVVIGINWYESMFDTKPDGRMDVSGGVAGGHAICLVGANRDSKLVTFVNSWGANWGDGGRGRLTFAQAERLIFAEDGEAVAALEVRV